ncbi:hypothetical protein AMS68_006088 [Peltaster fructicola]|uniref:Uncharacterized protein n=1 Tax=Peltaster fructicola TaxID=286661 RepID=A0A6H0Y0X3_9PEZI|nr:hypothetical protein AMS68_006088 [Peltaster fructicola]
MLSSTAPRLGRRCIRHASTLPENLIRLTPGRSRVAVASYQARAHRKQRELYRSLLAITIAAGSASLWTYHLNDGKIIRTAHAEAPSPDDNPVIFEKSRKRAGTSKEENRDMISSQHHQVKRSWENPGVYAWGSNAGKVVAPDSNETVIKSPRRISFFDGKLLRDIKLDKTFGAAIDEGGNLLQWGTGYSSETTTPVVTLAGRISRLCIPVSKLDQEGGNKVSESTWIPFWNSRSNISYRKLAPTNLSYGEKVAAIAGGTEHALLLTSKGRVFSAASASDAYPARGQLGIPGLSWLTRPEGAFDAPHEIATLRGFDIQKVAAGDHHSLALDKEGRLFAWGDNTAGQLGFDSTAETAAVDVPSLVPLQKLYSGTGQIPKITSISAGGQNTFFTVDAVKTAPMPGTSGYDDARTARDVGKITADTFALGSGLSGNLANNRWTHIQSTPTKIPSLSGLFEYDEVNNKTVPIRLAYMSVGDKHASAVMENITYLSATAHTSNDDTNWGADIVFWGSNEYYQLGTGKRNNIASPVYLQPLDIEAEEKRAKRSSGGREEHRFHITPRSTAVLGDGRRLKQAAGPGTFRSRHLIAKVATQPHLSKRMGVCVANASWLLIKPAEDRLREDTAVEELTPSFPTCCTKRTCTAGLRKDFASERYTS